MSKEPGVDFYYIDGPLKGMRIKGDFRDDKVGYCIYKKVTYVVVVNKGERRYRYYCDIAYSGVRPMTLPEEAERYIVIEILGELVIDNICSHMQVYTAGSSYKEINL